MDDIGLKLNVHKAKWTDLLKESNAGKLMIWYLAASAPLSATRPTQTGGYPLALHAACSMQNTVRLLALYPWRWPFSGRKWLNVLARKRDRY